ncbi:ORF6N domain-containing protein, partial [Xenorhabdus sp. 12]
MVSITVNELTKHSRSVEHMIAIMHNSVPVITTEMLANVYETDAINIQVNHSRNKERFIEGKHFFKLTGSILKEFKNRLTQSKPVKNRLSLSE